VFNNRTRQQFYIREAEAIDARARTAAEPAPEERAQWQCEWMVMRAEAARINRTLAREGVHHIDDHALAAREGGRTPRRQMKGRNNS
jgi:hypothetical protein